MSDIHGLTADEVKPFVNGTPRHLKRNFWTHVSFPSFKTQFWYTPYLLSISKENLTIVIDYFQCRYK